MENAKELPASSVSRRYSIPSLRSWVYDTVIVNMTKRWYREVLTKLPIKACILDVGIGTGTSLLENRDLIVSKQLHVTGVDYDEHYVITAIENVKRFGLERQVEVVHASIHDYFPAVPAASSSSSSDEDERPFDAIYFSGSFMIIPDKAKALQRCIRMLKPTTAGSPKGSGRVYFTQTFEHEGVVGRYVTPWVKAGLKALLTIDFGSVTFEKDFLAVLEAANVEVEQRVSLGKTMFREQVLIVAKMP
jgi:ubiquinone/menaquinone biosynthesis C-methylase UbiE